MTYGDGARIAHPKASGNSTHARDSSAHATHKSTLICAAAMSNVGEGALKFMEVNSTDSIRTNQWVAASAARAKPASEFEPCAVTSVRQARLLPPQEALYQYYIHSLYTVGLRLELAVR